MMAIIFEAIPREGKWEEYIRIAGKLRPELDHIDGFISVERYQSLTHPEKVLSLSFWKGEQSIQHWRNAELHRKAQKDGRESIFADYRIRVATIERDYRMVDRTQAPADSQLIHQSQIIVP